MAIFSRIALLACIATSSLLVAADLPVNSAGQVTARHLRHPQARAHHAHVARAHPSQPKKRSANKKRACAAKKEAAPTSSVAVATTTSKPHTTSHSKTSTTSEKPEQTPDSDPVPSYNGNGKAGLAWNDGNKGFMDNLLKTGKVTWCYTWSPWSPNRDCEFVPMLWSGKQIDAWNSQVVNSGKKFKNILAFNEPDQSGQAHMDVGQAISLWNAHIEDFPARHGSPAVTSSPNGLDWLDDFVAQCNGCKIDFLCVHHYGMDADQFIKMIKDLHNRHPSKPIWVTEWACHNYGANQERQCSLSEVKAFMDKTQKFLDDADYVERYAWFGALTEFPGGFNTLNRLINSDGSMTALGYQYIS